MSDTTPRIRGASARDVETARAIVSNFNYSSPVLMLDCANDSEQWVQVVAAALAEREAMAVERCALIAENWIASIFPKDTPVDCETVEHMLVNNAENIAQAIRADAARLSETP